MNFRNKCEWEKENCNRRNRYEKDLKKTTAEKCKPLCPKFCISVFLPVCGIYRFGKAEFLNICYMNRYNCLTGQTYIANSATRCRCYD
ncbi:U-Kazal-Dg21.2-like [Episyrphus balteatus]|uniref:U-Kazal-Dg21.2-like n=1 Tax=Episyrphus balteatus TaxID=286459 RepID=UPI0024863AE9|nr:U-Kazal-Dg21.2-like [Episyrphus balteatus]